MKLVRRSTEVTLSFNYRASNLKEAEAWKQTLLAQFTADYTEQIHSADYTYPLPKEFLSTLYKLWQTRESNAGYGDTFKDYYDANRSDRLTLITNLAGQKPYIAVPEVAENIHGWFDFTTPPEEDRSDVPGTWVASFSYKFKYDKPVQVAYEYPMVIHNQFIPTELLEINSETDYSLMLGDRNRDTHRMDWFRTLDKTFHSAYPGVRVPHYDDWWGTQWPFATHPLVTALIGVDAANPTAVNSIVDFEDFVVDPVIVPYFTQHRTRLLETYFSPFQFTVYSDDDQLTSDTLTINEDLVLHTNAPMSQRRLYHIRLSLLTDLTLLSNEGKQALLNAPEVCLLVLSTLSDKRPLPGIVNSKRVIESEYDRYVGSLPRVIRTSDPAGYQARTVGYGTIIVRRQ